MNDFNRMTIVAAAKLISVHYTHGEMSNMEIEWGINGRCNSSSKSKRAACLAAIACDEKIKVMTENGCVSLDRALIEKAISVPEHSRDLDAWRKFVAGLRFDGFEINETEINVDPEFSGEHGSAKKITTLVRMLPGDIPGLDFREAENEMVAILDRRRFAVAKGHLNQALSAFQRGEWSSANGELRNFFESYLNEIAVSLGYPGGGDSKKKRDFLGGGLQTPFLLQEYNEWNANNQTHQYVQGLMSRMHPHGAHPGLSEEDDATFRLQITLITARLFLRRFDQRKGGSTLRTPPAP